MHRSRKLRGTVMRGVGHYEAVNGITMTKVAKVKVAREVVKKPADLEVLDLKVMIKKMVNFIRMSNV